MKLLANLKVSTSPWNGTAETIGADIAGRAQQQIDKSLRLDLPAVAVKPAPVFYIEMVGTAVAVTKGEAAGRQGKVEGQPAHMREVKLGCVFTQTTWDEKGRAFRDDDSTTYVGAIETAEKFGERLYLEAWNRGWDSALRKVVIGDGAV